MANPRVYLNLIGGEWTPSTSGKTFESRNPADTRQVVGIFQDSNAEDIQAAVAAAKSAFESWRLMPAPKRGEILMRGAQLLQERKDQYAVEMTREMGKPVFETGGDIVEAVDMAYFAGGEGRRMHGVTTPSEMHNKFQMSIRTPIGVCGLITPWNFPMAVPSWKLLPALVCGNTIVMKPAEDTPASIFNLVQCLIDVGLPPGVVNIVTGYGPTAGQPLVEHPDVPVISFTGSTETGRLVNKLAADKIKHVSLEMGGKNAMIVLDDADLDLVFQGAVWGAFGTSGQRCTATSRIIVQRGVAEKVINHIVEKASQMRIGDGTDSQTEMGPVINQKQMEKILNYIEIGKQEGATLRCGGQRLSDGKYANGFFIQPTVFTDVKPTMRIAQEEIFGPVLSIITVDNFDEAIEVANGVQYGLSSSIYTRDVNAAYRAMRDINTGIVYINAPTIGAEIHLPFGGIKATGNGHREAGPQLIDAFSEWKSVYVDFSGSLQRAQIDNVD
ncbi:MAG: aldehyde dehydrogenase family protein [Chloroflexi bacterium AL-W]|nr:aldehyde dehydrogenase family protein [Chloroflexi bacterium AL-N1]NOK65469.1 aldehyde dehydrogenase family protein [Chloroflexi bacterium AL-N10]NOK72265.1 aldehyde dehydrogenase family protein [Chloroflexi bacterium AL-N5]NOK79649.1 aldehyde dehydrogenase family protein [Chloroflexi bacterium AL-W]NOK87564.1 aldehyde dehydrogenase family protein [Chloroflexi bacterium AL-N15]